MGEHFCQFAVGWTEQVDPIECGKIAPLKVNGNWFCAEHYDELEPLIKPQDPLDGWNDLPDSWGCDFSLDGDETVISKFPLDEDDPF
jgi:hypothetical protein